MVCEYSEQVLYNTYGSQSNIRQEMSKCSWIFYENNNKLDY